MHQEPYDQRRENPAAWLFSLAVICAIAAVGLAYGGIQHRSLVGCIGVVPFVAAVLLWRRSRQIED